MRFSLCAHGRRCKRRSPTVALIRSDGWVVLVLEGTRILVSVSGSLTRESSVRRCSIHCYYCSAERVSRESVVKE